MKHKNSLERIDLPDKLGDGIHKVAQRRMQAFVDHWAGMQRFENGMSVHELCRHVYLQGLTDGVYLIEKRRLYKQRIRIQANGERIYFKPLIDQSIPRDK